MKATDLPALIVEGRLDSVLDRLGEAVINRKEQLKVIRRHKIMSEVEPGQLVRVISQNIRPKYLSGCAGIVQGREMWKDGRVAVQLTTRRGTNIWHMQAEALEVEGDE